MLARISTQNRKNQAHQKGEWLSQTSLSQNSKPTRSSLWLPDHVTGDFSLNFELPSCLAYFLTVSSAVLQSYWITGSKGFLSGKGTFQRYVYAPSCMCAFPFTSGSIKSNYWGLKFLSFFQIFFSCFFFLCFNNVLPRVCLTEFTRKHPSTLTPKFI